MRQSEQQDLKDHYDLQINQLKERIEGLNNKANQAKKEADMIRETLVLKEKEIATLKKRLQGLDES